MNGGMNPHSSACINGVQGLRFRVWGFNSFEWSMRSIPAFPRGLRN